MSTLLAVSGGSVTWYVARATGLVTLGFLTASVLLGILTSFRWSSPSWPRFVVEFVHRNVSLLVLVFLAVHVITVVADAFAPIRWIDVVVPFVSAYRPFWLGLGAVAFDLLLALVVTSLLRHRLGYTTWRAVHWLAYACWPVAVLHGLGTGSDSKSALVLGFTGACVVAVLVAAGLRIGAGVRTHPGGRALGLGAIALAPVLFVAWLVSGPLASGWAARAGTPASVLASSSASASASSPTTAPATAPTTAPASSGVAFAASGFDATAQGTVGQSSRSDGEVVVSLTGMLSDGASGTVDVEIIGAPLSGGGVSMRSGTVTLSDGTQSYRGDIVGLQESQIVAQMPGPGGSAWQAVIDVTTLDQKTGTMRAIVHVAPGRAPSRGGDDDRNRGEDDG